VRVLLDNFRREKRAFMLYVEKWYSDLCGLKTSCGLSLWRVRMLFSRQHLNASQSNLVLNTLNARNDYGGFFTKAMDANGNIS
jgi:hypothetical protein